MGDDDFQIPREAIIKASRALDWDAFAALCAMTPSAIPMSIRPRVRHCLLCRAGTRWFAWPDRERGVYPFCIHWAVLTRPPSPHRPGVIAHYDLLRQTLIEFAEQSRA